MSEAWSGGSQKHSQMRTYFNNKIGFDGVGRLLLTGFRNFLFSIGRSINCLILVALVGTGRYNPKVKARGETFVQNRFLTRTRI